MEAMSDISDFYKEHPYVPRVGVGVMIFKNNKMLLQKRSTPYGFGTWSFPGGHLEYMETLERCAERETLEETGIKICDINFQFVNNSFIQGRHYMHVGFRALWQSGEATIMEPHKVSEIGWFDINYLPKPLFPFCELGIESFTTNMNYFEAINETDY